MRTLPVCLIACLGSLPPTAGASDACDFDCTLMRHLDDTAIAAKER